MSKETNETDRYVITKREIDAMPGLEKTHFLNPKAKRNNKSLGDLTGLTGLGFHIITLEPGCDSTEYHVHHYQDECAYVLEGEGTVVIGDERFAIGPGDFIGYRARGKPHMMINDGPNHRPLKCIVVGQRTAHEVGDFPKLGKRVYIDDGKPWALVNVEDLQPVGSGAGKK